MKEKIRIDDMYYTQLDAWEDLLTKVLHAQSDAMRLGLRSIHPEQAVDSFTAQLFEHSYKQLENWVAIEQEFLSTIIQSIKGMDPAVGYTPEWGKETAHRFIDHWGNRGGKALEAHTDFYSLIFPWNDGEVESSETEEPIVQEVEKTPTKETLSTAA